MNDLKLLYNAIQSVAIDNTEIAPEFQFEYKHFPYSDPTNCALVDYPFLKSETPNR